MEDKIYKYFEVSTPAQACNLRCHYCYVGQKRDYDDKVEKIVHTAEEIRRGLSKERIGGTALFNFCAGGETLLNEEIIPIIAELCKEGHYVSIVTNCTLRNRFEELISLPKDIQSHIFIKASFHYLELKAKNLLEKYAAIIKMLDKSEISYSIELVPSDEAVEFIPEIKQYCEENFGALCHVTIARDDRRGMKTLTKYPMFKYKRIWSQFDSPLFDFKLKTLFKKVRKKCYGGVLSGYINIQSGDIRPCYAGQVFANIYENMTEPLNEHEIKKCPFKFCYNGHCFLTLGIVPEIEAPYYIEMRDRIKNDGSHWVKENFRKVYSQKLYNNHEVE